MKKLLLHFFSFFIYHRRNTSSRTVHICGLKEKTLMISFHTTNKWCTWQLSSPQGCSDWSAPPLNQKPKPGDLRVTWSAVRMCEILIGCKTGKRPWVQGESLTFLGCFPENDTLWKATWYAWKVLFSKLFSTHQLGRTFFSCGVQQTNWKWVRLMCGKVELLAAILWAPRC